MKNNEIQGGLHKSVINWFPGHMAKAKKELMQKLKLVDLVIELRDARIPFSSQNPLLKELIGNKPRLIILSKSLMADQNITKKFIDYFNSENILALDVDLVNGKNVSLIKNYITKAASEIINKRVAKGIINKEVKIMVVGIPNVGKSTFINKLASKRSLNVGNRPGVTKSTNVWIKITNEYLLLDTPGILWPKFESEDVAAKLALCGAIKDELLPIQDLTIYGINYLKEYYPQALKDRYNLTNLGDPLQIIEEIGKNRGALRRGGEIDLDKVYKLFLQDVKNAKLGAISYERPSE